MYSWGSVCLRRFSRQAEADEDTRSLLVDARGIPLSLVVSGARRHDVKLLEAALAGVVVGRPKGNTQHLCADKGYAGKPAEKTMRKRGYVPHVRQRGEEARAKKRNPRHRNRRWVVERTHSWLNRYRKLLTSSLSST